MWSYFDTRRVFKWLQPLTWYSKTN
jgi:hypothetical protein